MCNINFTNFSRLRIRQLILRSVPPALLLSISSCVNDKVNNQTNIEEQNKRVMCMLGHSLLDEARIRGFAIINVAFTLLTMSR